MEVLSITDCNLICCFTLHTRSFSISKYLPWETRKSLGFLHGCCLHGFSIYSRKKKYCIASSEYRYVFHTGGFPVFCHDFHLMDFAGKRK